MRIDRLTASAAMVLGSHSDVLKTFLIHPLTEKGFSRSGSSAFTAFLSRSITGATRNACTVLAPVAISTMTMVMTMRPAYGFARRRNRWQTDRMLAGFGAGAG